MAAVRIRRKGRTDFEALKSSSNGFVVPLDCCSMDGVKLTPALAQYLLDHHNGYNRPVKDTRVDQYVMEMQLGKWVNTGERILFDASGNMVSGQHRCLAVIKSGVTIEVDMKFGLPVEYRDFVDTGCVRSSVDILRLTGDRDAAYHTKVVNGVKKIINRRRTGTSPSLARALMVDFARGLKVVSGIVKGRSVWGRGPVAGAFILAAEAHPKLVGDLLEALVNGSVSSDAAKELRRYADSQFSGGVDNEDDIADKVLFGIYKHLKGESMKRLLTSHHDEIVEYFISEINHELVVLPVVAPKLVDATSAT